MLFDKLCSLCERHMGELSAIVNKARVFRFDGRAHEVLPKKLDEGAAKFLRDEFFLPFQTVAIEDSASCVVLIDKDKENIGIGQKRYFVECLSLEVGSEEFRKEDLGSIDRDAVKGHYVVIVGSIEDIEVHEGRYKAVGSVLSIGTGTKESLKVLTNKDFTPQEWQSITESGLKNALTALEEVMYFNTPDRFVLEISPTKQRKKKDKLARSHDRPYYILLKPSEIRRHMKLPESGEGAHSQPHERRRHTRFLTSPRFVHKRWTTIVVPSTWVGTSSNVVGKKRYKVMLNI